MAFVIGAAVGEITALLLAPEKGEVTRRRLREGSQRAVRRSRDAVAHAATVVEETAREKAQTVTHTARQQAGAVRRGGLRGQGRLPPRAREGLITRGREALIKPRSGRVS